MNTEIMKKFRKINGEMNIFIHQQWIQFPELNMSDDEIIKACRFIKKGKAYGNDGIGYELFNIRNHPKEAENNNKKIKMLRQLT